MTDKELNTPTEYSIRNLTDFARIPPEKLDECLIDFKLWVKILREQGKQIKYAGFLPAFIWVDDGARGLSQIKIGGKR